MRPKEMRLKEEAREGKREEENVKQKWAQWMGTDASGEDLSDWPVRLRPKKDDER